MAVAPDGSTYLAGFVLAPWLPVTEGAFDPICGNGLDNCWRKRDAFVIRLGPDGSPMAATYLGGGEEDVAYDTQDRWGNCVRAFRSDAFVTSLDPDGRARYSTLLGGEDQDRGLAIAIDGDGRAYVTGASISLEFPLVAGVGPDDRHTASFGFVTVVKAFGDALALSTPVPLEGASPRPSLSSSQSTLTHNGSGCP